MLHNRKHMGAGVRLGSVELKLHGWGAVDSSTQGAWVALDDQGWVGAGLHGARVWRARSVWCLGCGQIPAVCCGATVDG